MSVISVVLTVIVFLLLGCVLIGLGLYKKSGYDERYIIITQVFIVGLMFANAGIQYFIEQNLIFAILFILCGIAFIILVNYKLRTYQNRSDV